MQFKIFKRYNLIQGVSDSSFGSIREEKRAIKFLNSLSKNVTPQQLVWAEQVFSSNVHICQKGDSGRIIKNVDGLISPFPGQILVIITGDCLPILLFDPKKKIVSALHGGRECLRKGIIQNTIKKMIENFNSNPKDILVGLGPHIRVCHYWLKERTYQDLKNTEFKKYFKKKNKFFFDLTKLAKTQLQEMGVKKASIEDSKICTYCQYQKYFSARKEEENPGIYREKNSRFASFIGLTPHQSQRRLLNFQKS